MIRAVTTIVHIIVYCFTQMDSYNFAQPLDAQQKIIPEGDVTLKRMSGAALCQIIKLRKDTCSENKARERLDRLNYCGYNSLLSSIESSFIYVMLSIHMS